LAFRQLTGATPPNGEAERRRDRSDISQNTLRVGDHVRMWVSPNRDPSDNRVRLKRIERPADHWRWGGHPRDTR
jgi:hypothetical protein